MKENFVQITREALNSKAQKSRDYERVFWSESAPLSKQGLMSQFQIPINFQLDALYHDTPKLYVFNHSEAFSYFVIKRKRRPENKDVDPGDLSEVRAIRDKLQCKTFEWYMKEIGIVTNIFLCTI